MNLQIKLMLITGMILALCAFCCRNGFPAPQAYELVEVRTMDNCPRCVQVDEALKADKVTSKTATTEIQQAAQYPTCIYRGGDWDTGERVLSRQYWVRGTLRITKWKPRQ